MDRLPRTHRDRVLAGVKAKPSGLPPASLDPGSGRSPWAASGSPQHTHPANSGLYAFRGLPVSAPRKYDEEFRDRAVRMYRDRLAEPGESKLGARRHVGSLLDLNQATLRNWIEDRYNLDGTGAGSRRSTDSEEVRALKKRVAELERANEVLKTSAAFFGLS